jgi:phage terminase large subunit-like protein
MTDFNLVNLKQDNGLLGASQKLKKGNAGKEQVQMLPFLCIMGQICRITTQETEKILFNPPPRQREDVWTF